MTQSAALTDLLFLALSVTVVNGFSIASSPKALSYLLRDAIYFVNGDILLKFAGYPGIAKMPYEHQSFHTEGYIPGL